MSMKRILNLSGAKLMVFISIEWVIVLCVRYALGLRAGSV